MSDVVGVPVMEQPPMLLSPVAGTWAWDALKADWPDPRHAIWTYLRTRNIAHVNPRRSFQWSTRLDGFWSHGKRLTWRAAGINYHEYLTPSRCLTSHLDAMHTVTVTHSHGLQVALFAAADGLYIPTLVDVAGPVRKDMMDVAIVARKNIGRWIHIYAGDRDRMQWFGEMKDGALGIVREHPLADVNFGVLEADHGEVLRLEKYWPLVAAAVLGQSLALP